MDERQRVRHSELEKEWGDERNLNAADRARLRVLACIEVEMEKLQAFVNQHGPTYQVRGKSGDTYSRARPEYQQLQEARQRYSVMLDRLASGQISDDSADGFLAP